VPCGPGWAGVVAAVLGGFASAQDPAPPGGPDAEVRRRIAGLIGELGSDDVARRDRATRLLTEAGEAARSGLREAEPGASAEVRGRISRILRALDYGVLATRAPWTLEDWERELGVRFRLAGAERRKALRELGLRPSDDDFAKAEGAAPGAKPEKLFQALLDAWADADPRSAAAWAHAVTLYVTTEKDDLLELAARVVLRWARKDREAAAAWAKSLPEGPARAKLVRALEAAR